MKLHLIFIVIHTDRWHTCRFSKGLVIKIVVKSQFFFSTFLCGCSRQQPLQPPRANYTDSHTKQTSPKAPRPTDAGGHSRKKPLLSNTLQFLDDVFFSDWRRLLWCCDSLRRLDDVCVLSRRPYCWVVSRFCVVIMSSLSFNAMHFIFGCVLKGRLNNSEILSTFNIFVRFFYLV